MKYTRDFLKNGLKFTEDEAKLIMKAQRMFPSILDNEGIGLCLDGRILYKELGVSKAFSTWIKSNLERVEAVENEDYSISFKGNVVIPTVTEDDIKNMTPQQRSSYGISEEYILSLEIGKEICMVTGINPNVTSELIVNYVENISYC